MGKFAFTDEQKKLLGKMCEEYESKGIIHTLDILNEYARELRIAVQFDGGIHCYFNESIEEQEKQKRIGLFVAALLFLNKLKKEELIHSTKDKINELPIVIPDDSNLEDFGEPIEVDKDVSIDGLLLHNYICILDPELIDYIENEFKTDEEIRFENQMSKAKRTNGIALGTAIVTSLLNIAAIVANICVAYYVPTTIKDDNIDSLRQSIESTKSVKVENDTLAINAKVDTVTVKQAVKPVTKKKKTNK